MIISLEEARKILGEGRDDLSDEQLEDIILTLNGIARETIQAHMRGGFCLPSDEIRTISD
jgi:hypothetical protein